MEAAETVLVASRGQPTAPMYLRECLGFSLRTLRRQPGALLWMALLLALIELGAGLVLIAGLGELGGFLCYVLAFMLWGGYLNAARSAANGRRPKLRDVFSPLWASAPSACATALAVMAGLLACGVGVVATSTLFIFAPLLVNDGASAKAALLGSKDLVLRRLGPILLLNVVLATLNGLGSLTLLVGLIGTMTLSALAVVRAYELTRASAPRARTRNLIRVDSGPALAQG